MATAAISYRVRGSRTTVTAAGLRHYEVYVVSNVSGRTSTYDAIGALPAYGDPHPTIPNLFVTEIDSQPYAESKTQANVIVTYAPPDFSNINSPIIRFSGTTQEVTSNFDFNGDKIVITYNGQTQTGQIPALEAAGILEIERIEAALPVAALTYINSLNSSTWQGQPKGCWLMRSVDFEKELYRAGYRVRYRADYKEKTWVVPCVYTDKVSGYPPDDIDNNPDYTVATGNGWTNVQAQKLSNFNTLSLPAVFG